MHAVLGTQLHSLGLGRHRNLFGNCAVGVCVENVRGSAYTLHSGKYMLLAQEMESDTWTYAGAHTETHPNVGSSLEGRA